MPVVPIIILLLLVAILGGFGFAAHLLWIVLAVLIVLWVAGFFLGAAPPAGTRRRWYGRW